ARRAILVSLRESGCRPAELRRARVERCFLAQNVLYVPNKTARKTGAPERKIYLSEEMKGLLKSLIGDRTEGFIFLTAKGQALDLRQPPGAVAETCGEGAGPEGRHAVHLPQDIHIRGDQQEERQPRSRRPAR